MTKYRFAETLLAAAALFSPVLLADTAGAETKAHPRYFFTLTMEGSSTDLRCWQGGGGGSHPDAAAACDSLFEVGGNFDELNNRSDTACPAVYEPVMVYAKGWWDCEWMEWEHQYGNSCSARFDSGSVFDF